MKQPTLALYPTRSKVYPKLSLQSLEEGLKFIRHMIDEHPKDGSLSCAILNRGDSAFTSVVFQQLGAHCVFQVFLPEESPLAAGEEGWRSFVDKGVDNVDTSIPPLRMEFDDSADDLGGYFRARFAEGLWLSNQLLSPTETVSERLANCAGKIEGLLDDNHWLNLGLL